MTTASLGHGNPDFIIGKDFINILVELKSGNGKLTKDEDKFKEEWKGSYLVAYSYEDITAFFDFLNYRL